MTALYWEIFGVAVFAWQWLCAALAAKIALEKGRPEWEPWVYGFLFGPLGILIIACLPTRAKTKGVP
jgi:hypothetical protein